MFNYIRENPATKSSWHESGRPPHFVHRPAFPATHFLSGGSPHGRFLMVNEFTQMLGSLGTGDRQAAEELLRQAAVIKSAFPKN